MFQGRGTAYGDGGGKEKGELHGQSMGDEREVCRCLIMGEDRMLGFILRSVGEPLKGFTQRDNVIR